MKSPNDLLLEAIDNNLPLVIIKVIVEKLGADVRAWSDYALRYAANNGHLEVVKYLIDKGADVRAWSDYALRLAANNGHLEVVKYLIDKGADVRALNDYALRYAAFNGHLEVVKYLKSIIINKEVA